MQALDNRIAAIGNRLTEITHARLNGTATAEQNGEFLLLTADREVLESMRTDRQLAAEAAQNELLQTAAQLQKLESDYKFQQDQAHYEALKAKTRQIEDLFVRSLGLTAQAAQKLGIYTMAQAYGISQPLRFALILNVAPEVQS